MPGHHCLAHCCLACTDRLIFTPRSTRTNSRDPGAEVCVYGVAGCQERVPGGPARPSPPASVCAAGRDRSGALSSPARPAGKKRGGEGPGAGGQSSFPLKQVRHRPTSGAAGKGGVCPCILRPPCTGPCALQSTGGPLFPLSTRGASASRTRQRLARGGRVFLQQRGGQQRRCQQRTTHPADGQGSVHCRGVLGLVPRQRLAATGQGRGRGVEEGSASGWVTAASM